MGMKHLKVANGCGRSVPTASREASDICMIDYSQCPNADVCWILDFSGGCATSDSCVIDTH